MNRLLGAIIGLGLALSALANGLVVATGPAGGGGACPQGVHAGDGCPGAPVGTIQYPNILSGYVARPAWNVAAVDYYVGIPSGTTLTDWQSLPGTGCTGTACAGVTVNTGTGKINIGSTGTATFDKVDFSLHGGSWVYNPSGSASTLNFTNSKFAYTSTPTGSIYNIHDQNGASLTVTNCNFDGTNYAGAAFLGPQGHINITYNRFQHQSDHVIEHLITAASPSPTVNVTFKYNLIDQALLGSAAHMNYYQSTQSVSFNTNADISYNTTYQSIYYNVQSTVTISNASPAIVTWTGSGFAEGPVGETVKFTSTGTLPSPIAAAPTEYFVMTAGLTANSFEISSTGGSGPAINTTTAGSGTITGFGGSPGGEGFQPGPNTCTPACTWTNPNVSNNTMMAIPDAGKGVMSYIIAGNGINVSGGTNNNNNFDVTGAFGAYYPATMGTAQGWANSGNINMSDGTTITP